MKGLFVEGNELNLCVENIFKDASSILYIISPYIKLHYRIRDVIREKQNKHKLAVVVLFGKNESDKSRSIDKEDLKLVDKILKHPRSFWRSRSALIAYLLSKSLPEAEKEIEG